MLGFSSIEVVGTDAFRFLGHWDLLRPFPLGMVASANCVKLGDFGFLEAGCELL